MSRWLIMYVFMHVYVKNYRLVAPTAADLEQTSVDGKVYYDLGLVGRV